MASAYFQDLKGMGVDGLQHFLEGWSFVQEPGNRLILPGNAGKSAGTMAPFREVTVRKSLSRILAHDALGGGDTGEFEQFRHGNPLVEPSQVRPGDQGNVVGALHRPERVFS